MEDLAQLFQSLSVGDNQIAVLEQLKSFFIALPTGYLRQHAPNVDFSDVFECLQSNDMKQIELACDVLQRIFRSLSPDQIYHRYKQRFFECLSHSQPPPREIVLRQLQESVDPELPELLLEICGEEELVYKCASLIGDSVLSVAVEASKFLSKMIQTSMGKEIIFKSSFLHHLENICSKSDEVRFRVYELFVKISCISEEYLTLCLNANLLQPVFAEVAKDDILVQLNALELLIDLATNKHTLMFMINEGILDRMNELLLHKDAASKFLVCGVMKFFGTVARIEPRIVLQKYSAFTDLVFSAIADRADSSSLIVAMDTLGFIGETLDGKIALSEQGNKMAEALTALGSILRSSPTDLRVKCLQCLQPLFDLKGQIESNDFLRLMESWFNQMDKRPLETLVGVCKQPFVELRLPGLQLLSVLSEQSWFQHLMSAQPGLAEFLMDRAVEPNQESRNAKYEVVARLARSPTASQAFGQAVVREFQEHYREGPYFFRSQAEVAMESGQ